MGSRVLAAVDQHTAAAMDLVNQMERLGLGIEVVEVSGEPSTVFVEEAASLARTRRCDLAVGIGGGSAMDTAKAVAALLSNDDLFEYLETVGKDRPLARPAASWIAVPTTAGTGAEATSNAVLFSPEQQVKVSLRHPSMLASLALIDPELTLPLPPGITASSGLDALTQLIEPFVCSKPNAIIDTLCRDGIKRIGFSLPRAFHDGSDLKARENMMLAALFSGMALANAKLGAVHGIAGPLGGMTAVPHGVACARLLPIVMEINLDAMRSRTHDSSTLTRYQEVAVLLSGNPNAPVDDGYAFVRRLVTGMCIPKLSRFGLTPELFPSLIEKAKKANSMKGNPVELTNGELRRILEMEEEY